MANNYVTVDTIYEEQGKEKQEIKNDYISVEEMVPVELIMKKSRFIGMAFHVESDEDVHTEQFIETMDKMKEAQRNKQVKYFFGYSNLAFDLWIVLHKSNCNGPKSHRRQYLSDINRAYDEQFENMHQYKHEDNFKRCLSKLTLGDVKDAVQRAKNIMKTLKDNQAHPRQYKGFEYYTENPSLEIWRIVEKILIACKL